MRKTTKSSLIPTIAYKRDRGASGAVILGSTNKGIRRKIYCGTRIHASANSHSRTSILAMDDIAHQANSDEQCPAGK
jgi:hypothetical protein